MKLLVQAYAKVNLSLEVLGRRPDGFHEISTVLQTVSLHDTLVFQEGDGIHLQCDVPELDSPQNLVVKAAQVLQEATGCKKGAVIRLKKRIPIASGLGGGSSDGAASLLALNRLWGLGLSLKELTPLAARLGSDVPFFLYGGTALGEGRGELVTSLPPPSKTWFLLVWCPVPLPDKTATLYGLLGPQDFTRGVTTKRLVDTLKKGEDLESSLIFNTFDTVASDKFPQVREHREAILAAQSPVPHLTGTGPTLFSLVKSEREAKRLARRLRRRGLEAYVVHSVETHLTSCHLGIYIEEDWRDLVDDAWLRYWAAKTLDVEGTPSSTELSVVVTDDETVRRLNARYRGVDEPTDVLSFPLTQGLTPEGHGQGSLRAPAFVLPPDGIQHLGEVIISYPYAARQAKTLGHSVPREIAHLLVHGVLHLLGYNHEDPSDEEKMRARERDVLGWH